MAPHTSTLRGFSLVGWARRLLGAGRRPEQHRGRTIRPFVEPLEDRTLLAVTAQLAGGVLDVRLDDADDAATVSFDNDQIRVTDGTTTIPFSAVAVHGVTVRGTGADDQTVTLDGTGSLVGALRASGLETVTVQGTLAAGSANLSASDTIAVAGTAALSTRRTAGDPFTGPSTADSGNLTLSARHINVGDGARLLAGADNGFFGGDVTLTALEQVEKMFAPGVPGFKDAEAAASIDLGAATVTGHNVSIRVTASTVKSLDLEDDLAEDTRATAVADVNGDGRPDLVTANHGQPVRVYLSRGTADPFGGVTPLDVGGPANATSIAVGDVNRDGRPDLVVGTDAGTRVFLNGGGANPFPAAPLVVDVGQDTTAVALGDLNGDGWLELVTAGKDRPTRLYFNTHNPTIPFTGVAVASVGTAAGRSTALALADFDGSGRPDLVVTRDKAPALLYLNNGNLTPFSGVTALQFGGAATSVAAGDVTGDGRPDVVLGSSEPGNVRLFVNNGSADPFAGVGGVRVASADTAALALGDVNGDRRLDLVIGNRGEPSQVLLNDGSTNPFGHAGQTLPTGEGKVRAVALGDLNLDGRIDAVVGTARELSQVYFNTGDTADPFGDATPALITPEQELRYDARESGGVLGDVGFIAQAVRSEATATLRIGAGATITAADAVTLDAEATAGATALTLSPYLAVTYGSAAPTATATVEDGATIVAGGDFDLRAVTNTNLNILTYVPTIVGTNSPSVVFSCGKVRADAAATLAAGSRVTAFDASVRAENSGSIVNTAGAFNLQTGGAGQNIGGGGVGAAIAIGDYESSATASGDGLLETTRDTAVEASSVYAANLTRASATVINPIQNKPVVGKQFGLFGRKWPGLIGKVGNALKGNTLKTTLGRFLLDSGGPDPGVAISGAVNVVGSENTASARVGSTGRVTAGGNATVHALAREAVGSSAVSSAGDAAKVSFAGAVNVADFSNRAAAVIDDGARVDAAGTLAVKAEALEPHPFTFFDFHLSLPDGGPGLSKDQITASYRDGVSVVDGLRLGLWEGLLKTIIAPDIAIATISTSAAYSGAPTVKPKPGDDAGVGVAGGVSFLRIANDADAHIGRGARINQRLPGGDEQDVQVKAVAKTESLNVVGQASVLNLTEFLGGGTGKVGAGGSFNAVVHDNGAVAYIDDGAKVKANRDVSVTTDTHNYQVQLAQAGAKTEAVGVQGAIAFNRIDNKSLAHVEDGATIDAGRDLVVRADSGITDVTATGGVAVSETVGVGISASLSDVESKTRAFLGDGNNRPAAVPGSVTVGRDLSVTADTDQVLCGFAVAGAFATGVDTGRSDPSFSEYVKGRLGGNLAKWSPVSRQFGFGVSGAVVFNYLDTDTQAFIRGTGYVRANGKLTIAADADTLVASGAGAVAYGNNAGIGGAVVFNLPTITTQAFANDVSIRAGSAAVTATSDGTFGQAAGGGAGTAVNASVAGSVIVNIFDQDTRAFLGQFTDLTTTAGGLVVTADNGTTTWDVAGAASVGLGRAAVGAALDVQVVHNTVRAYLDGESVVRASGDVRVSATADEALHSITAHLSAGDGAAVGGSVSAVALVTDVEAFVGPGGRVDTPGNLALDADDEAALFLIAGGAAGGFTAGIDGSLAVADLNRTTKAYLGDGAVVSARGAGTPSTQPGTLPGVALEATAHERVLTFAAGVAGGGTAGVTASLAPVVVTGDTAATIGAGARVNDDAKTPARQQSVSLTARHDTDYLAVTGSFAGAPKVGVGAASDVLVLDKDVTAEVGAGATVRAARDITIASGADDDLTAIAGAVAVGGGVEVAGSFIAMTLLRDVRATVGDGATVHAGSNVRVDAEAFTTVRTVAGQAGFGGTAGVGVSSSTVVATDITEAIVGADAGVTALAGNGAGLFVTAQSRQDLLTITAGVQVGRKVGVAGSVTVNVLNETTRAVIGDRARINEENDRADPEQDVWVSALNGTRVVGAGGAVAVSFGGVLGPVGVGAGADVLVLTTQTEAGIGAGAVVNAADDIVVRAGSREDVVSAAGSVAVTTGSAGVAGAASVATLSLGTRARVGDGAAVTAGGNAVVSAADSTDVRLIDATLAGGVGVGAGAGIGVAVIIKNTEATVGASASVTGRGLREAASVENGLFDVAYSPYTGAEGEVAPPTNQNEDADDESLGGKRRSTARTQSIRGVAVTAVSWTALNKITAGVAAAAGGALEVAAGVDVVEEATRATIGVGARINAEGGAAGPEQSVLVAAGVDFSRLAVVGSVAVGLGGAVGPALDVALVDLITEASTGDQGGDAGRPAADVRAVKDVRVLATASEDVLSVSAGLAGAVGVAVGGAISVFQLDSRTSAKLGGIVTAGGNALVAARDDTDADVLAGSGALALGLGVGASAGVNLITKRTTASVDLGATVTASGNTPEAVVGQDIDSDDDVFATKAVHGLSVQAASRDDVHALAVSGAVGAFGGVAGAVTFTLIRSDTTALVSGDVNPGTRDVNVGAVNDARVRATDGAGGLAVDGMAGSVDVTIIRNSTLAGLDAVTQVNALGNVDVSARSRERVESRTIGVAAGAIGVAGAASVIAVGGAVSADGMASIVSHDGANQSADDFVDRAAQAGPVLELLRRYSAADGNGDDPTPDSTQLAGNAIAAAGQRAQSSLPAGRAAAAVNAAPAELGATAFIGDHATVTAGGHIRVVTKDSVSVSADAGGGSLGLLGFGGSVAIVDVSRHTRAIVGDATLAAGGVVTVAAILSEQVHGAGYAGSVGGFVGLGAQVVELSDHSQTTATIRGGADIRRADQLTIAALSDVSLTAEAQGGAVSPLGIAAGVAIARVTSDGATTASLGDSAQVGVSGPVRAFTMSAAGFLTGRAESDAVSGGLVAAGQGSVADIHFTPVVTTTFGERARVTTAEDLTATTLAATTANADADGIAVAGGVEVGVSEATADVDAEIGCAVGKDARLTAGRDLTLVVGYNVDPLTGGSWGRSVTANASASGGALFGIDGATSLARTYADVTNVVKDGAILDAGRDLSALARTETYHAAAADGFTVGVIAARGTSRATVDSRPTTSVTLGDEDGPATARAGRQLTFNALAVNEATTTTDAAVGGIATGMGSDATTRIDSAVRATLASSSAATAGGNLEILADSVDRADANACGTTSGVDSVGTSRALTYLEASVVAQTGQSAAIHAGGDLTFEARHDINRVGVPFQPGANARAEGSVGGLLGDVGADAQADSRVLTLARIGKQANVSARSLHLTARSDADADADADGNVGGLKADGASSAQANVRHSVTADFDARAQVETSGDLTVVALESSVGAATADAGAKGGVADFGAKALALLVPRTVAGAGDGASLSAGGRLQMDASSLNRAVADATVGAGTGYADAGAHAFASVAREFLDEDQIKDLANDPTTYNPDHRAPTIVTVGAGAQLAGQTVILRAVVDELTAQAASESDADAFASDADATAATAALSEDRVTISSGATVRASDSVELTANHFTVATRAIADSDSNGLGGDTNARSRNTQIIDTTIDLQLGALIATTALDVTAATEESTLVTLARADGSFIDSGGTTARRNAIANRIIVLDGTIWLQNTAALEVDAHGNIVRQLNVPYHFTDSRIVVDRLQNDPGRAPVTIWLPALTLHTGHERDAEAYRQSREVFGAPHFRRGPGLGGVTIVNDSALDLELNPIVTSAPANPNNPPALFRFVLDGNPVTDPALFEALSRDLTATLDQTPIDSPTVRIDNRGPSDVYLSGFILAPYGVVTVSSSGGSIWQTSPSSSIFSRTVRLRALQGEVGSAGAPIRVMNDQVVNPAEGSLHVRSQGDMNVSLATWGITLDEVESSQGDVHISGVGSIRVNGVRAPRGTVSLSSGSSIISGQASAVDIAAVNVALSARLDVGQPQRALVLDSSTTRAGSVSVTAGGHVRITEASGALRLAGVTAGGDVTLLVPDAATTGQNLTLSANGAITSGGVVTLLAGDNVDLQGALRTTSADGWVVIRGDYRDADPGVGAKILVAGSVDARMFDVAGGRDDDRFTLHVDRLGAEDARAFGGGGDDTLTVRAPSVGSPAGNPGVLTADRLTGMGIGGVGLAYAGFEQLSVRLSNRDDRFFVRGTSVPTTVNTLGGDDVVRVSSAAGTLDSLAAPLTIDAGKGSNTLLVSEAGSTTANTVTVTASSIRGGAVPFVVRYKATGGTFAGGVRLKTGSAADTVNVLGTLAGSPTTIETGSGDDAINVTVTPANASNMLTVNGGLGFDALTVTDPTGTAVLNVIAGGGGAGRVQGSYLGGPEIDLGYLFMEVVRTLPTAE